MSLPICNHCHRRPAAPDRKRCEPCLAKARDNARRRYLRLRSIGTCAKCGARPAAPGEARCAPCADRHLAEMSATTVWPRLVDEHWIETIGGYEFGPYATALDAHGDVQMRRLEDRYGECAVTARTVIQGTPDLDDLRTPRSSEIG